MTKEWITCPACKGAHGGVGADGVENDCSKCENGMVRAAQPAAERAQGQANSIIVQALEAAQAALSWAETPGDRRKALDLITRALSGERAQGGLTDWNSVVDDIANELQAKSNLGLISQFTALCEEFDRRAPTLGSAPQAERIGSELPSPEITWLYTHCRAIGMTCKSESGKWEHDIALFTINQQARIAELDRDAPQEQAAEQAVPAQPVIWYDAKHGLVDVGQLYGDTRMLTITGSSAKFGDYTTPLYAAPVAAERAAVPAQSFALKGGVNVKREARENGTHGWLLYTDSGRLVRALNRFEQEFVDCALAAAPSPAAAPVAQEGERSERPALTVWYGSMPETNGKSNFTATLMRKGASMFDTDSYTFARSEYPDRVRYEADSMRYLIGELADRPDILDYDADKHSGYAAQQDSAQEGGAA